MSRENINWFPSKIDWWVAAALALPLITGMSIGILSLWEGNTTSLLIGLGMLLGVGLLYWGLIFPMRYGLSDSQLVIRCGICRWTIPLQKISSVNPTSNPLSSPALSLDRLHIQYGPSFFNSVMISPQDSNLFLQELAQKAGLKRAGDRLYSDAV
ncbi:MAG: PH domain-containing protein [Pirellulales bacterium]|nr:PH domain-containing protein [Pirellulales bacterium]